MKELQAECGSVRVGDKLLEGVFNFSYLGSDFQANGDHSHAMKPRSASDRCGRSGRPRRCLLRQN